jgi:acyl-CoA dehydrogenase
MGVLEEYPVERWLREATILSIWQGTPHRQSLDGLEAMERKGGDRLHFQHVAPTAVPQPLEEMASRVEDRLALPAEEREANVQEVFRDLAVFTADPLLRKHVG